MVKRPLFPIAVAFALGIVLVGWLKLPFLLAVAILGIGCVIAISRRAFPIALLMAVVAAGVFRYDIFSNIPSSDVSNFISLRPTAVVGRIASDIDLRPDKALFPLEVSDVEVDGKFVPCSGNVMVVYYEPDSDSSRTPKYGDRLIIRSRISRPSGASNPGDFSYRDYLARQQMYAITYVKHPEQVTGLPEHEDSRLTTLAIVAKDKLSDSIASKMPPAEAATMIGMDLGTYAALPDELLSDFQKTGTLHLLAASGFNCGIILVVFGYIFSRLLKLPRPVSDSLLFGALIFYLIMAGVKPSILRATIMACLWLLGRMLWRPSDTLNLLFGAALVILAINPSDLFDVSFQLSFAAVLSIVMALPIIQNALQERGVNPLSGKRPKNWIIRLAKLKVTHEVWQAFLATIAATLGTLPLTAFYFNQVSLVSIPVNAIVAITVLPIFVIGFLLPLVAWIPVLGDAIALVGTGITKFALSTIHWFGGLSYSSVSIQSPGATGVIGYYILLFAFLKYIDARKTAKKS